MRPKHPWLVCCLSLFLLGGARADSTTVDAALAAGNYAEARTLLLALSPDSPSVAARRALALGQVCRQLQLPDEAKIWLDKTRTLLQSNPEPILLGSALIELAELDPPASAPAFEEAWQVLQTCTQQPEHAANARLRFAEVRLLQADYPMAKTLMEEALAWLNGPVHRSNPNIVTARARAEQNLGHWHLVMGDYPAALEHLHTALATATDPIPILGDLALAHWRSGDFPTARETFRQALGKESRFQPSIRANYAAAALSELDASSSPAEILQTTTEIITSLTAPKLDLHARLTLAEAQRQRAVAQSFLGQDATATLAASKAALDDLTQQPDFQRLPPAHALRRNATTTRWALAAIASADPPTSLAEEVIACTIAQMQALPAAKTEAQRLAFLDHLDLASPVLALPAAAQLPHVPALLSSFGLALREAYHVHTLTEWQATLPTQSSFLNLFTFRKPIGQTWQTTLAALIVNPSGPPVVIDLDYTFDGALKQANLLRDNLLASAAENAKILNELGKNLWTPLTPHFPAGTNRIFLFLEGALASLPIPFLRVQDQALLDSKLWITFIATPTTLFHRAGKLLPLRPGTWLGVDASNVPVQIPSPKSGWNFPDSLVQNRPFTRLTQVGPELTAVSQQHPADWQAIAPNEAQLRQALLNPNVHVWHFAGHGVSDSSAANGRPSPFSNCLVCPQVNLNLPPAENGLLYAGEVASLNLAHLDLAVLSACDTGRGGSQRSEAVFDFARACHSAGVRDVLVSTTPVADPVAPVLMQAFYEHIRHGKDASEAAWMALRTISHTKPNLPAMGSFRLVRGNTSRL